MARLLRIERAITWIARTLIANRDANPTPAGVIDQILPTIDTFGSQRAEEIQFETVQGALGGLEVFHDRVPDGSVRQYLSMEYDSDDSPTPRRIRPGRIVATAAGFPFAGMRDEHLAPRDEFFAIRNFTVGPGARAAVRANVMSGGARMTISVLWIETPLGEYVRSLN